MQYIIEKPYKMVTKNAKKNSNFSTFVRFLGPFLKKWRFWKMGNFETNENFWVKFSANLPHQASWKMNAKWVGVAPVWYLTQPFFKNTIFSKMALKPNKSWKFKIFFCIFGNHFIGLFNGILHVLIFWVVAVKQKDFDWGYVLIWNRLYHSSSISKIKTCFMYVF